MYISDVSLGGWCPATNRNGAWYDVRFTSAVNVTTVILQPPYLASGAAPPTVTEFQLLYEDTRDPQGVLTNYTFSTNGTHLEVIKPVYNNGQFVLNLTSPVVARRIRILVANFTDRPCLRMDIKGCPVDIAPPDFNVPVLTFDETSSRDNMRLKCRVSNQSYFAIDYLVTWYRDAVKIQEEKLTNDLVTSYLNVSTGNFSTGQKHKCYVQTCYLGFCKDNATLSRGNSSDTYAPNIVITNTKQLDISEGETKFVSLRATAPPYLMCAAAGQQLGCDITIVSTSIDDNATVCQEENTLLLPHLLFSNDVPTNKNYAVTSAIKLTENNWNQELSIGVTLNSGAHLSGSYQSTIKIEAVLGTLLHGYNKTIRAFADLLGQNQILLQQTLTPGDGDNFAQFNASKAFTLGFTTRPWTNTSARSECEREVNFSAARNQCSLNLLEDSDYTNCMIDVVNSGLKDWSKSLVQLLIERCEATYGQSALPLSVLNTMCPNNCSQQGDCIAESSKRQKDLLVSPSVNAIFRGPNNDTFICKYQMLSDPLLKYNVIWAVNGMWNYDATDQDDLAVLSKNVSSKLQYNDTIQCAISVYRTGLTEEFRGPLTLSDIYKVEIQILNWKDFTLYEGDTSEALTIKATAPPYVLCRHLGSGSESCHINIDISLSNPVESLCPNGTSIPQAVVAIRKNFSEINSCGIQLTNIDWQSIYTVQIKATTDLTYDGNHNLGLNLTKEFIFNGISHSHQSHFAIVRLFFRRCAGAASCNCAAKAGDDVIVIDECGPFKNSTTDNFFPMTVKLYRNGKMTPGFRIISRYEGRHYEIIYPTGTVLEVSRSAIIKGYNYINVWLKPSPADVGLTTGLCGILDGNKSNDLIFPNGTLYEGTSDQPMEYFQSLRKNQSDTLYTGSCDTVAVENQQINYCYCEKNGTDNCGYSFDVITCPYFKSGQTDITERLISQALFPMKCIENSSSSFPFFEYDTNVNSVVINTTKPSATGKTYLSYFNLCKYFLGPDTSEYEVVQKCAQLPAIKLDLAWQSCALDLYVSNDLSWVQAAVQNIQTRCQIEIEKNRTLWEGSPKIPPTSYTDLFCIAGCGGAGNCVRGLMCFNYKTSCFLDGVCYEDGEYNPLSPRQYCNSSLSISAWQEINDPCQGLKLMWVKERGYSRNVTIQSGSVDTCKEACLNKSAFGIEQCLSFSYNSTSQECGLSKVNADLYADSASYSYIWFCENRPCPQKNITWLSKPGFTVVSDLGITKFASSIVECHKWCLEETSFLCRSIQLMTDAKRCYLSPLTSLTAKESLVRWPGFIFQEWSCVNGNFTLPTANPNVSIGVVPGGVDDDYTLVCTFDISEVNETVQADVVFLIENEIVEHYKLETVPDKSRYSVAMNNSKLTSLSYGTKVISASKLVVIEGQPGEVIQFQSLFPPAFLCDTANSSSDCTLVMNANVAESNSDLSCPFSGTISQILFTSGNDQYNSSVPCGVEINSRNWKNIIEMSVVAKIDNLIDGNQTRQINITGELKTRNKKTIWSSILQLLEVTAVDQDTGGVCVSMNDPYLFTFDGRYIENYYEGEFIMYAHKDLPYGVRTFYRRCSKKTVGSCTCAAAIKCFDDVIVIDRCGASASAGTKQPINITLYQRGELTPGISVRRIGHGLRYEILLPTGTKVEIDVKPQHLNVLIVPSANDFNRTKGLCGDNNGVKDSVLTKSDNTLYDQVGNRPDPFSLSWRVQVSQSLLSGYCGSLLPIKPSKTLCQCFKNSSCSKNGDTDPCNLVKDPYNYFKGEDITKELQNRAQTPSCKIIFEYSDVQNSGTASWPTQSNYTEAFAKSYCAETINKTQNAQCLRLLPQHYEFVLSACVKDIQLSDDLSWALSSSSVFTSLCRLTYLSDIKLWHNTTKIDLNDINNICFNSCSSSGNCSLGTCKCNPGFVLADCSLNIRVSPLISSLANSGLCDITKNNCTAIQLFGATFAYSDLLICKLQEIEILNNRIIDKGSAVYVKANYFSFNEITCYPPTAGSYKVQVSNNNQTFSEVLIFTLFDPGCHTCTSSGACSLVEETCFIENNCYSYGTENPKNSSLVCDNYESHNAWSNKQ
ncbi:hypothetical protein Btru_047518, partial [Bulinus truncatus]